MYKIMLVDDESEVREAIRESIDWPRHGYEFVGGYANGAEALEAILDHRPDLVLSDICMPHMDGIEMTKQVAQAAPDTKVVILTGHDEFDYAQQALRLKVHDFVIKPITPRELRALLDKIKIELDREAEERDNMARLREQLQESLPLLKERFLECLVQGSIGEEEAERRFAYFGLVKPVPPLVALAVDIDQLNDSSRERWENNPELQRYAAYKIASETTEGRDALVFRTKEERVVVLLYGFPEEGGEAEISQLAESIRRSMEKYMKFTVTIGVGAPCSSLSDIPWSYEASLSALDYRFLLGNNRVIRLQDLERPSSYSCPPDYEWNRKFASALKTGTHRETHLLIEQFIGQLKSSPLPLEVCYVRIQSMMIDVVSSIHELLGESGNWLRLLGSALQHIDKFHRLEDVEAWLKNISCEAIELIADRRSDLSQLQVRSAIEYIEQHYREESLSLMDICNHVHMSKSYFSTLFKQHTGQTMMEYVTRIRLETAKTLLQANPPIKTYDIAAGVGYGDPQYFSVLFKKHVGVTPTEYRDAMAKESTA